MRSREAAFAVASAAALLTALLIFAERRVAPLLQGDLSGEYTTRVYGAPRVLRVSDPLPAGELRERLRRLRYEERKDVPEKPGQFHKAGDVFSIYLRAFDHPSAKSTPSKIELTLGSGRVRSLRLLGARGTPPAPLLQAVLEPELVFEISGAKRIRRRRLEDADIPPYMAQALVAVEDRRFYDHFGLDPRGTARALVRDLRHLRIAEGGSTLTQQLARALFLGPRRTFSRKIQEALIALYLEARFSKREILRMYLDSVYFGQRGPVAIVGLSEAARHYFDKEPRALTLGECAMLAGLLRSPYLYDPFRRPDEALERRRTVLAAMRAQGMISAAEEARARLEPVRITRSGQPETRPSDYFMAFVERELRRQFQDEALLTRGISVYTTLDPWLQELASAAVHRARQQAALVALDARTGAIRALVGGKDYLASPYDRAALAHRQPGSAFKPFVYGAALAVGEGWTPASLLDDTSQQYKIPSGTWTPRNHDRVYHGKVPLRDALAQSLNAASVHLAASVGVERVIAYARELGITSDLRPELGLALGTSEVTLLELTRAYCAFANGGSRVEPHAIEAVLDSSGEVLSYRTGSGTPAIAPAQAYVVTSLLRETAASGTAKSLRDWGLETLAAGKTGTSDDGKDAWFIGYTPRLAAGVWTGSDVPQPLGLTGAGAALPVWADFMRAAAYPDMPPGAEPPADPWPVPDGVTFAEIDPESGMLATLGCPRKRREVFLSGTEPKEKCPLHAGGIGGWLRGLFRKAVPAVRPPQAER
ncbi:MAG TPA: PBP1A family penicillin-binding protein [Elusimicrobiota bacterium]|nr:PBP1A family penicillin-binding protein [Elusimicrobiota bacterium]